MLHLSLFGLSGLYLLRYPYWVVWTKCQTGPHSLDVHWRQAPPRQFYPLNLRGNVMGKGAGLSKIRSPFRFLLGLVPFQVPPQKNRGKGVRPNKSSAQTLWDGHPGLQTVASAAFRMQSVTLTRGRLGDGAAGAAAAPGASASAAERYAAVTQYASMSPAEQLQAKARALGAEEAGCSGTSKCPFARVPVWVPISDAQPGDQAGMAANVREVATAVGGYLGER